MTPKTQKTVSLVVSALGVALLGWAQALHIDGGDPAAPFRLVLWWSVVPLAVAWRRGEIRK